MNYMDDITKLKGVGEKTAKLFHRLEIQNIRDLLHHFPRDYEAFGQPVKVSQAPLDEPVTLRLTVLSDFQWKKVRQLTVGSGVAADDTGRVTIKIGRAHV